VNNPTHPIKYNVPPAIMMVIASSFSMLFKLVTFSDVDLVVRPPMQIMRIILSY
jgi:hypothetical protein